MTKPRTLEEIAAIDRECLTPAEICGVLGCGQYAITIQAREDHENGICSLGFPTICIGRRVLIPKKPFLRFMGWAA